MANKKLEKAKYIRLERDKVTEIGNFLFQMGNQFLNIKNAGGAFECFKYALDMNDKMQPAVYNIAVLYSITGDFESAYKYFGVASRMDEQDLNARVAYGEMARKLGKFDEAREVIQKVCDLDPSNFSAISAMSILLYDTGRLAEASAWNDKVLEKRPTDVHAGLNRALIGMAYGEWKKFWPQYEYFLSYQKNERLKQLKMSDAWAGQELEGKTLAVISDQGFGDCVQMSRYLREAKAKGKFAKLTYVCQNDMVDMMRRVDGVDEAIGFGDAYTTKYDAYSSLLGVMRVLEVEPDNCWRPPHITTDPLLDPMWEHRINSTWDGKSKKVALVWAGDKKHGQDFSRSIPLAQFLRLAHGIEGVQFYSVQVGPTVSQLESASTLIEDLPHIEELGSDFRNFDDTASALAQMDLLVSCDTSPAHVAGCMGIPTWVLVAQPPEWRFLLDRTDCVWYKTTRVFRQSEPRDWGPVIDAVKSELKEWAKR